MEALKKFDELIAMQKELYGDRSESVIKSSNEAAIICNILSMSFLQKGECHNNRAISNLCNLFCFF